MKMCDHCCSIIIPHKNSVKLLERLIISIQKEMSAQIIIVDDYSSNENREALKNLKQKYQFELYNNEGKTAGGARNTGLKYAKGEWLIFADADDYFEPTLAKLFNKYKESNADIIFFPVTSRYSDTGQPAYRGNHVNLMHKKYKETGKDDYLRYCHLAPWGKMIKRKLVEQHSIRYEECIAGNDNWFSVNTGLKADKVIVADKPIYCITVSSGSLTTTLDKEKFEAKLQSSLRTNKFLRSHNKASYQISILYFIAGAYQFGLKYFIHVIIICFKMKANPLIGIRKLLHPKTALSNRQNNKIIKDNRK